jgi:hypothetical protein
MDYLTPKRKMRLEQLLKEGITGTPGPSGPMGPKGEQGERGPQGVQGERGPQGLQGIQGVKGDKGEKGDPGYTPIKGIDYFDGLQGPKGDRGDTGEQGLQGIQGIQGEPGSPANVYDATTSVKGVIEIATLAEVSTGTDTVRAVTPQGVKQETNKCAKLTSGASLPTASSSYRGQFYVVQGATGVADTLYVCLKQSNNTYQWIALNGFSW